MASEFDLIAKYFDRPVKKTALGIGDDCALLTPAPNTQMAISCDMLVSGTHFFPNASPRLLGHKSLAVNLSDLAAMGAKPVAFTLALSLPSADEAWLAEYAAGLFALADAHECELIGGDTTRGPLNICVTVFGQVPQGQSLRRDAAQVGDDIWVSGTLGSARLGLGAMQNAISLDDEAYAASVLRLHQPTPRVALGMALNGIAHAAIDISDGLVGDIGHILKKSGVGASIDVDAIPVAIELEAQPDEIRRTFAMAGGDDYELCFTVPASKRSEVEAAAMQCSVPVTRVGRIEAAPDLRLVDAKKQPINLSQHSFDHFGKS